MEPKELRKILNYDPATGKLMWRKRDNGDVRWNKRYAGTEAFTNMQYGYHRGTISGHQYLAHRVAWALHYGEWPSGHIDHINGVRSDNRLINLRSVTRQENSKNIRKAQNNASGITGVYWHSARKKWEASIGIGRGRRKFLGCFDTLDSAADARKMAEKELGYHENHGRNLAKARDQREAHERHDAGALPGVQSHPQKQA